jgi:hypothetical protein
VRSAGMVDSRTGAAVLYIRGGPLAPGGAGAGQRLLPADGQAGSEIWPPRFYDLHCWDLNLQGPLFKDRRFGSTVALGANCRKWSLGHGVWFI